MIGTFSTGRTIPSVAGRFEANAQVCTCYLGSGWELAKVPGTSINTGDFIGAALDVGSKSKP